VICGFGRIGANFSAERFGVQPDMITMAKALTNGAIPMGAVAASETIYKTITEAAGPDAIEFFHGYTYSAHPAACAAGVAALAIYEKDGLFERARQLEPHFQEQLHALKDLSVVTDIRGMGLLAGVDLAADGAPGVRGYRAMRDLYAAGVLTKVTGDCMLLAPPFIAEPKDIDRMFDVIRGVLEKY
jgi:beta-alanine--pyruvate transaminase